MNKTELIDLVSQKAKLNKKDSGRIINTLLSCMVEELTAGGKIKLINFGLFKSKERTAKIGRNPSTTEPVLIPASKTVVFKAGKNLKKHVNTKGMAVTQSVHNAQDDSKRINDEYEKKTTKER